MFNKVYGGGIISCTPELVPECLISMDSIIGYRVNRVKKLFREKEEKIICR